MGGQIGRCMQVVRAHSSRCDHSTSLDSCAGIRPADRQHHHHHAARLTHTRLRCLRAQHLFRRAGLSRCRAGPAKPTQQTRGEAQRRICTRTAFMGTVLHRSCRARADWRAGWLLLCQQDFCSGRPQLFPVRCPPAPPACLPRPDQQAHHNTHQAHQRACAHRRHGRARPCWLSCCWRAALTSAQRAGLATCSASVRRHSRCALSCTRQ
jgi:hypothetical protein